MIESARRRIPRGSTRKSPSHGFFSEEILPRRSRSSSSALGLAVSDCACSKNICPTRRATAEQTSVPRWFDYPETALHHTRSGPR